MGGRAAHVAHATVMIAFIHRAALIRKTCQDWSTGSLLAITAEFFNALHVVSKRD